MQSNLFKGFSLDSLNPWLLINRPALWEMIFTLKFTLSNLAGCVYPNLKLYTVCKGKQDRLF
jgi:hypothetical protein